MRFVVLCCLLRLGCGCRSCSRLRAYIVHCCDGWPLLLHVVIIVVALSCFVCRWLVLVVVVVAVRCRCLICIVYCACLLFWGIACRLVLDVVARAIR